MQPRATSAITRSQSTRKKERKTDSRNGLVTAHRVVLAAIWSSSRPRSQPVVVVGRARAHTSTRGATGSLRARAKFRVSETALEEELRSLRCAVGG